MVVGSINIDLVLRVERLPKAGETVAGGTLERHGGGKGANQAVAASRAGAEVRLVGAVGDDDFGEQALEQLRQEKVDLSGVVSLPEVPTGVACVIVDDRGENQIAVASGANAELDASTVEQMLRRHGLPAAAVCLLNFEITDPPLLAAAQCAAAAGIERIVVNPAPARPVPRGLLELEPILTPNAGELDALVGADDRSAQAAAGELSRLSGAPVVVTLGSQGAIVVSGEESCSVCAPSLQAVDATGAGDAFNGALAAALAQGHELLAAVQRARGRWLVLSGGPRCPRRDADRGGDRSPIRRYRSGTVTCAWVIVPSR